MSFGFSVGDILAVSKFALHVCKQLQDAGQQFIAVRDE
jgi:hypothetical protein